MEFLQGTRNVQVPAPRKVLDLDKLFRTSGIPNSWKTERSFGEGKETLRSLEKDNLNHWTIHVVMLFYDMGCPVIEVSSF
jgi:hypothetical protein